MVNVPLYSQCQAQDIVPTVGFTVEKFISQRSVLKISVYISLKLKLQSTIFPG